MGGNLGSSWECYTTKQSMNLHNWTQQLMHAYYITFFLKS